MKLQATALTFAMLASTAPLVLGQSHGDPFRPVGTLHVDKDLVRTGSKPGLSWGITYPTTAIDVVTAAPSPFTTDGYTGAITTTEEVRMTIRVIGVGLNEGSTELPAGLWTSIGGGGWEQVFYGTNEDVKPGEYGFDEVIPAGTTINFAGRGRNQDGTWDDIRWTNAGDESVVGLTNGDLAPSYSPSLDQGQFESFLTGYLTKDFNNNGHGNNIDGVDVSNDGNSTGTAGSTETVEADGTILDDEQKQSGATVGPLEFLYLFELDSTTIGESNYDLQDLAVVVSFERTSTSLASN